MYTNSDFRRLQINAFMLYSLIYAKGHVYNTIQRTHYSKIVHSKDSVNLTLLLLPFSMTQHSVSLQELCGEAGIL